MSNKKNLLRTIIYIKFVFYIQKYKSHIKIGANPYEIPNKKTYLQQNIYIIGIESIDINNVDQLITN